MIKVEANEGTVKTELVGSRIDLLAEAPGVLASILGVVLDGLPKEMCLKLTLGIFECVLNELKMQGVLPGCLTK